MSRYVKPTERYVVFPHGKGFRVWDKIGLRNAAIFRVPERFTVEQAREEAEEWAAQRNAGNDVPGLGLR